MIIGEVTLRNPRFSIEIRAFTIISGQRILNRMITAWESIPQEALYQLMIEISHNLNWSAIQLRDSIANQIFVRNCGRGNRHEFCSTTVTLSSRNPNFVFLSIEIDRSRAI